MKNYLYLDHHSISRHVAHHLNLFGLNVKLKNDIFLNSSPTKINASVKPIRFTVDEQFKPGKYRSEILVQNNPDVDLYIKRLRVAFHAHDDLSRTTRSPSSSPRSHSLNRPIEQKSSKSRSTSLPRSNSQAVLHQWIDDICSNKKLMADDDICFFIRNGEFLARI